MLNGAAIDELIKQTQSYERDHFGMKNGPEFPAIASALLESGQFTSLCKAATAVGLVSALLRPSRTEIERDPNAAMDKLFADSPLRPMLAEVFYLGYCAGKADAQVSVLEKDLNSQGEG